MADSVKIRKAQLHDLKSMGKLLGELFAIEDDFTFDLVAHTKALSLLFYAKDATLYVAKSKNRVVGMVSIQSVISTVMGGYVGLIEDMIVTHDFRGQGVGKQLLTAMIEESKRLGYTRLTLGADLRNTSAISFYKTFGFESSNMGLMYRV